MASETQQSPPAHDGTAGKGDFHRHKVFPNNLIADVVAKVLNMNIKCRAE